MSSLQKPLETASADRTPDSGPVHRGGPFTWFVALACGFAAIGAALLLRQQDRFAPALLCSAVFGATSLYAIWCLVEHLRHRTALPRSHAVLSDALGFEIHCTCHDVAATVFFLPDETTAGATTRLLCFVENYSSRHRIARFRIGPHRHLGLEETQSLALQLAPGQAAVYSLPLLVSPDLAPGEHDLPVTLHVQCPSGSGVLLPGARRHLYDVWTARFAAPFTVPDAPRTLPSFPLPAPEFISLASVSDPAPRLDSLTALIRPADLRPLSA